MLKLWFLSLLALVAFFMFSGIFLKSSLLPAYYYMTMSMSVVSFIYYFIVLSAHQKDKNKMIGGNLAAIVIKFILSLLIVILYAVFFRPKQSIDFAFYFTAYILFSLVNYFFSYRYKNQ